MGIWNVDELASQIPFPVFMEWVAFAQIEPFGDDWRRTGRLATVTAAAAGANSSGDLEEKFLPNGGVYRGKNQTEQQMLDEIRKIPGFESHRGG